ncbi:DUF3047 domain-containing protein [Hydrogenophaga sp. RWCD_12]|uniref:DUF3047 domain-containing protein n=1 Tax=Hydrogenophaga sp. RWCD_12 TaxID=3391190 RepID=UPI003984F6B3
MNGRFVRCLPVGALLLAALQAQAQSLPPLVQADGTLHAGWRVVGFPKKKADIPPTLFEAGKVDGQPAVKVVTASSYGTLVHDLKDATPARLSWRWRLDQPLSGGKSAPDLTTKAGDDAALKVCAMFDHPLDRVPFVERTVLRLARSVSGEALPAATICYIWDSGHAAGLQGANPYTRRVRYISLRGSETPAGQWATENRDIAQDFITLFGDELPQGAQTPRNELPKVATVLLGADSDNTASRSQGWVADLQIAPSNP